MNRQQLWELREEIVLNSLFLTDYDNSFRIDNNKVCNFFEGYVEFLYELAEDDGQQGLTFFEIANRYDSEDNLWEWYNCYDEDPLPQQEEEEE